MRATLRTVVFILPVVFIITLVPAMITMLNNLRGDWGLGAVRHSSMFFRAYPELVMW